MKKFSKINSINLPKHFLSNGVEDTKKIAQHLVKYLMKLKSSNRATVIGLVGKLGAGKTYFVKGIAKQLKVKQKIVSPSFVIMKRFEVNSDRFSNFYHLDCYRIKSPKEILNLNINDILNDSSNLVVIEWAEKIKEILPSNTIWVKFEYGKNQNQREITISSTCTD